MGTCAMMLCLRPVAGLALICDEHKAERIKECKQIRSRPNYNPLGGDELGNGMCTLGSHVNILRCACTRRDFWGGKCTPCEKCHFCGGVHPFAAPVAA